MSGTLSFTRIKTVSLASITLILSFPLRCSKIWAILYLKTDTQGTSNMYELARGQTVNILWPIFWNAFTASFQVEKSFSPLTSLWITGPRASHKYEVETLALVLNCPILIDTFPIGQLAYLSFSSYWQVSSPSTTFFLISYLAFVKFHHS